MRKISRAYENCFDNIIIDTCDRVAPAFKAINCTPNTITTFSLISGLISVWLLHQKHYIAAAVFYSLSYFFDCLDGHFARKYGMVTEFGDIYDHVKDIMVFASYIYVLFTQLYAKKRKNFKVIIVIFAALLIGCTQHLSYQEQMYGDAESFLGKVTAKMFKCEDESCIKRNIQISKWAGCGTLNAYIVMLTLFLKSR